MASHDEHQRIAAAMHAIRPEWNPVSLTTYLDRNHLARPYADLLVAGVVVAMDADTKTPALLERHGRWWEAAAAANGEVTKLPPRRVPCGIDGHAGTDLHCAECIAALPTPDEIARIRAEGRKR